MVTTQSCQRFLLTFPHQLSASTRAPTFRRHDLADKYTDSSAAGGSSRHPQAGKSVKLLLCHGIINDLYPYRHLEVFTTESTGLERSEASNSLLEAELSTLPGHEPTLPLTCKPSPAWTRPLTKIEPAQASAAARPPPAPCPHQPGPHPVQRLKNSSHPQRPLVRNSTFATGAKRTSAMFSSLADRIAGRPVS